MNPSDNDPDDKLVIDPAQLQLPGAGSSRPATDHDDETTVVRARGTREQLPVAPGGAPAVTRTRSRELARDPAEVLRAWPVSMGQEGRKPPQRAPTTPPPGTPRVEDKITLAHLALDLFREVEQIQVASRRAGPETEPAACTSPACDARVKALRGALIEACLLVQRVAMSPAPDRADLEDRIRELLALLDE
jgi:hypothetical protein